MIKGQLKLAVLLSGDLLVRLQTVSTDDSVPIDPTFLNRARENYALIRAGRHGFELEHEWNEGKKGIIPDALKELAFKRVDIAWNLARTPVDLSSSAGLARQVYIERSAGDLSRAIQLLNQALAILP